MTLKITMVKSNSAALKEYHACARRNKCGKKYSTKRKNTGDDENLQSLRKRLRKKGPAKKRLAKKKKKNEGPAKKRPAKKKKKGFVQGINPAPIQRSSILHSAQEAYLQRAVDNPNAAIEAPPMRYPPNYEENTARFLRQVKNIRGNTDALRALSDLQRYQQLRKRRDDLANMKLSRESDDILAALHPNPQNWSAKNREMFVDAQERDHLRGWTRRVYLTRLDNILGL